MNWKRLWEAVTSRIWIQVLTLIVCLLGVAYLTGASFKGVGIVSRSIPVAAEPNESDQESVPESSEDTSSSPLDDLFDDNSGAFGNWDDVPESSQTSSAPSYSRPQNPASSKPVQPSQPTQQPSAPSSESTAPPPSVSVGDSESGPDGGNGSSIIAPGGPGSESSEEENPGPGGPETGPANPGPSDPTEGPGGPGGEENSSVTSSPGPGDSSGATAGGSSPGDAPAISDTTQGPSPDSPNTPEADGPGGPG